MISCKYYLLYEVEFANTVFLNLFTLVTLLMKFKFFSDPTCILYLFYVLIIY